MLTESALLLTALKPPPRISLGFELDFLTPFLVNDPSQKVENGPDHNPLKNSEGKVIIPERSFRGALRFQAERILRTMGADICMPDDTEKACRISSDNAVGKNNPCLACRLFGAPGWQSPLTVSDLRLQAGTGDLVNQEFVAIDRFTGGGAPKRKFNTAASYAPTFTGKIAVDLNRLDPWALGLLALVMRDLAEGDIHFGFASRIDYGACRCKFTALSVNGIHAKRDWQEIADRNGLRAERIEQMDLSAPLSDNIVSALTEFVRLFQDEVNKSDRQTVEKEAAHELS